MLCNCITSHRRVLEYTTMSNLKMAEGRVGTRQGFSSILVTLCVELGKNTS
jgi:hypothetical protein